MRERKESPTFKILKTYVFNSDGFGTPAMCCKIEAPLIFVILCMMVLIVRIGVSDGRVVHHGLGSVDIKS